MACLRLFTVLPLRPLLSVPRFRSCMAFSTFFEAHFEQAFSEDGGKNWEVNWTSDMMRIGDAETDLVGRGNCR